MVKFNAWKTKLLPISLANTPPNFQFNFQGTQLPFSNTINIIGVNIDSNLSWHHHISNIARAASKRLGALFTLKQHFTPNQRLKIYCGTVRPCIEYCSHVWGDSQSLYILDRVEDKARRLVDHDDLFSSIDSLELRRRVGALSLFYRYFNERCSEELKLCTPKLQPPPAPNTRVTRFQANSHPLTVTLPTTRLARHFLSFFPYMSRAWNSLPFPVFPPSYNLNAFKRNVCNYLRGLDTLPDWNVTRSASWMCL